MARRRAGRARLPLEGYRVVEMAHHLSVPLAGMHLGDFGADVVKVEGLEGEDWRRWGRPSPAGDSQLFLAINRNKRSLSLDLGRAGGRAVLERLLASADVLLTNYTARVLRETLEARFRTRTTEEWLKLLVDAGVPAGRVQWEAAVFEHPQLGANGIVRRGRDPRAGTYRGMGFPLRLDATPARLRRSAPALGADSRAVLRELGLPPGEVARLVRAGAVRAT